MRKIASFCLIFLLAGCATSGEVETINRRLAELENRVNNQKLMELLQSAESTQQQLTVIRGDIELVQHELANTKKRQDDLYSDLDNRINEQTKKSQDMIASEAIQFSILYQQTMDLISKHQFEQALPTLNKLIQLQHQVDYIADTGFWMGITYTGLGKFDKAIEAYQAFVKKYPEHPRAPDALFNTASCQEALKKNTEKNKTLQQLLKAYPNSEVVKKYQQKPSH